MAEKRTIELEIQDNSKSLKAQYREAVAELQKVTEQYGATSREAAQAAAKAAQLKDEIQYSKDLVGAFNPDAKFNALSKSIGGVLDGFQAFEGAMGLVGVEGKAVQETMLKVQSAMALSQGIQGVMEAKDSFMQLGTVIKNTAIGQALLTAATTAYNVVVGTSTGLMKAFKIALISTGIGALVVGVGLLIANFDKLIGIFTPVINGLKMLGDYIGMTNFKQAEQDAILKKSAANRIAEIKREKDLREKLFASLERNYSTQDKAMDRQIALLKAQGKDTTALERARLKATIRYQTNLQNETYQMWVQGKEKNKLILQELYAMGVREKNFAEYNEKLKLFTEAQNELARDNHKANEARLDAINQLAIFEAEVLKANQERQSSSRQETTRQETTAAKEKIDLIRQRVDKEIALMEDGFDKEKRIAEEKAKREKEDLAKSIEGKVYDQEEYNKTVKLIDDNLQKDLLALNEKYKSDKLKTKDFNLQLITDEKKTEIDLELEAYEKKKAIKEKEKEDEIQRQKDRLQIAKDGLQLISDVTELFGRQNEKRAKIAFQVDKAAKLSSATIAGYEGVMEAYKTGQKSPLTAVFPAYPYVQAGLAAAFAATTIAKIAQSKFSSSNSGSGGGNNAPAGANAPAPMTANFSTIGSSGINQLAQLQQKPTQAYVVSGEVTSAQALDRNRVQNATL